MLLTTFSACFAAAPHAARAPSSLPASSPRPSKQPPSPSAFSCCAPYNTTALGGVNVGWSDFRLDYDDLPLRRPAQRSLPRQPTTQRPRARGRHRALSRRHLFARAPELLSRPCPRSSLRSWAEARFVGRRHSPVVLQCENPRLMSCAMSGP